MNRAKTAKSVAFIGMAAASLTAVKLALSWLANVELVTLLVVYYTLALGKNRTFVAVNIFILVECFLYGFGCWALSYLLHWNAVVALSYLLDKKGVNRSIYYALSMLGLTFLFGVQTSVVEVLFFSGGADFFSAVIIKYFMGMTFYIAHMASSFVSVWLLLPALSRIPIPKI